jgi:hypothetical protein
MCDYSLEHYSTTDAKQGESYTLRALATGSNGFVKDGGVVCMKEGSLLRLEGLHPTFALSLGVDTTEEVVFSKVPQYEGLRHHRDAVTFKNGRQILLQHLYSGCTVTVLMPPASTKEDRDLATPEPARPIPSYRAGRPLSFFERVFSL